MKLFVIEGPDNTGKSYFSKALEEYLKKNYITNIKYIHFDAPKSNDPKEAAMLEHEFSMAVAKQIRNDYSKHTYDAIILDRSWYSEYVYGHIYRKRTEADCLTNIRKVEDVIINTFNENETYYIYLTASPEFLAKHEDGQSLSKAEIDIIKKEIKLFDTLYDNVMLDNIIKLNVEDDNNYVDINKQLNKVITF